MIPCTNTEWCYFKLHSPSLLYQILLHDSFQFLKLFRFLEFWPLQSTYTWLRAWGIKLTCIICSKHNSTGKVSSHKCRTEEWPPLVACLCSNLYGILRIRLQGWKSEVDLSSCPVYNSFVRSWSESPSPRERVSFRLVWKSKTNPFYAFGKCWNLIFVVWEREREI